MIFIYEIVVALKDNRLRIFLIVARFIKAAIIMKNLPY